MTDAAPSGMGTHAVRHHHFTHRSRDWTHGWSHGSGFRTMDFVLLALLALALAFMAQTDGRPLLTH